MKQTKFFIFYKLQYVIFTLCFCGVFLLFFQSTTQAQCDTSCSNLQNLVQNGDFETGGLAPSASNLTFGSNVCAYGYYAIGQSIQAVCSNFPNLTDHTNPPSGYLMAIDGDQNQATDIWSQSINVVAGETYSFNFWIINTATNANQRPDFSIRLGTNVFLNLDGANMSGNQIWQQYCGQFTATSSGTFSLTIQQTNFGGGGYDYAIDDIFFGSCVCEITPGFNWALDDTNCSVTLTDNSQITDGNITGYQWTVLDVNTNQIVHTSSQASNSFSIPANTNNTYEVCLEVIGNDGECSASICEVLEVFCCDYDYLLENFTGVLCANDLTLDLSTWPANFGAQITLIPAFGQEVGIGINGGQVYDLRDLFNIDCGSDSCGVNPQYQLRFEADHPDCQFVSVTSDIFEVVCDCPCTVDAAFNAQFGRNCTVMLQDQSVIQGGNITQWKWEIFDRNNNLRATNAQPNFTYDYNGLNYFRACLTV